MAKAKGTDAKRQQRRSLSGRLHPGIPGEIISERRATSNRNGARDHPGIPGDFSRNQHSEGIAPAKPSENSPETVSPTARRRVSSTGQGADNIDQNTASFFPPVGAETRRKLHEIWPGKGARAGPRARASQPGSELSAREINGFGGNERRWGTGEGVLSTPSARGLPRAREGSSALRLGTATLVGLVALCDQPVRHRDWRGSAGLLQWIFRLVVRSARPGALLTAAASGSVRLRAAANTQKFGRDPQHSA